MERTVSRRNAPNENDTRTCFGRASHAITSRNEKRMFPFTSTMDSGQANQNNLNAMLRRPALDIHHQPAAKRHQLLDLVVSPLAKPGIDQLRLSVGCQTTTLSPHESRQPATLRSRSHSLPAFQRIMQERSAQTWYPCLHPRFPCSPQRAPRLS